MGTIFTVSFEIVIKVRHSPSFSGKFIIFCAFQSQKQLYNHKCPSICSFIYSFVCLSVHPSSFILHPTSYILHPTSFILHPSSFILNKFPYFLRGEGGPEPYGVFFFKASLSWKGPINKVQ